MNKCLFALGCLLLIIAISCSKTKEDTVRQPTGCDTTNMKYSANVLPILTSNCYSCHGQSTNANSGGIILEGYNNLKVRVDNGDLIGAITHASGYTPMPYNMPKLSDCEINTIKSWVNNGAQNN